MTDENKNIDLTNLPSDFFDKRQITFLHGINDRFQQSKEIIKNHFEAEKLDACFDFLTFGLLGDAVKGDINSLSRTWFFPSSEAEMELDNAINHCLIGSYKASYDHLRRGLELVMTNIYLTHENTPEIKAREWMASQGNSPYFSREVIANIIKFDRFNEVNTQLDWAKEIKEFYYKLCDIVHVNGTKRGFQQLNGTNFYLSGTTLPRISKDTIINVFGDFIQAMEYISLSLVLYNPVLLVDLPMTEKFGLNPPMCGFFEWGQSEIINKLIPAKYKDYCERLKTTDIELLGIKESIESMPTLTKEEMDEQIKDQQNFFDTMNNNNR